MTDPRRSPDVGDNSRLELDDNETFNRRDWAAQRVAFVLFTLMLLGAGLGLFGGGPLSRVTTEATGAMVRHERFARRQCSTELVINLDRARGSETVIELPHRFAQSVEPGAGGAVPTLRELAGRGERFHFATTPGEHVEVRLSLRHRAAGMCKGEVVVDGEPVSIWTFVYP